MQQNTDAPAQELIRAIRDLHNCESKWLESVQIKEMFGKDVAWEGVVEVFKLIDHPTAKRCYAWSHAIEGSTKRKFMAVLRQGPVKSPQDAVRAAIVSEYKKQGA